MSDIEQLKAERDALQEALLRTEFAGSKFVRERMTVPAEIVQATFGRHFDYESGRLIAKDATGNPIFSRERPGEPASLDEALEHLVSQVEYRDRILKRSETSSVDAEVARHSSSKKASISRLAFERLTPKDQMTFMKSGGTVHD